MTGFGQAIFMGICVLSLYMVFGQESVMGLKAKLHIYSSSSIQSDVKFVIRIHNLYFNKMNFISIDSGGSNNQEGTWSEVIQLTFDSHDSYWLIASKFPTSKCFNCPFKGSEYCIHFDSSYLDIFGNVFQVFGIIYTARSSFINDESLFFISPKIIEGWSKFKVWSQDKFGRDRLQN